MASAFMAMSSIGSFAAPGCRVTDRKLSSSASISSFSFGRKHNLIVRRYRSPIISAMAKELLFNKDGSAIKRLQGGVNKIADIVGVTLGPKGRYVVRESKYDYPKNVKDEVGLEDSAENISVKTNDLAGDGTTTSDVLAHGLIAEGVKVVEAGANPVMITRGIEKITKALVTELKQMSKEVEDSELADVAAVSAGNNYEVGNMIAEAMGKVGRKGVVTLEEGKSADSSVYVVDGMQFDRGHMSPYFVTDSEKMALEYENCKLLLVDKKITNARDLINILEEAISDGFPILVIAEDIEQESLATVVNKLNGELKIAALKAHGFGEQKSQYLDDIAILTGGTVVRDEVGLNLDKVGKDVLGQASKVVLTKDTTTIVGDGSTQEAVNKRVEQIRNLIEAAEQEYEKEKLKERIAKLSGDVAVIQVVAQTETELKEKKLRFEDALNAAKAAVEEGVVVGGGCTLLRLASKVDAIKEGIHNAVEKAGADIVKRALSYPLKLIAQNACANFSVVSEKVLSSDNPWYGYNAATGKYEDLMAAGIIEPTKVVRCWLEDAASVAKTFLMSKETNLLEVTNHLEEEKTNLEAGATNLQTSQNFSHLWTRCEDCYGLNYKRLMKLGICEHCGFHLRISSSDRIELLIDQGTWNPMDEDMASMDPLDFNSEGDSYKDRIYAHQKKTGLSDAIQTGTGRLNGVPVALGVMEFQFIGGSMGSVVGEKITRLIEHAGEHSLPLIIVCASGGARMQEGSLSLMQMAKISAALYDYQMNKKLLYIAILTSPTTGGVTASFGMLGDIIIAEPNATIAFAGKRVIEETLKIKVPEGLQEAEYLFEKGLFDLIVPRTILKGVLFELFDLHSFFPVTPN